MTGFEFGHRETAFMIDLGLAFVCGLIIGAEREYKGKPAGVSTQTLVIAASMLFSYLSLTVSTGDGTRIAAQVVSGIGFLGAGLILKSNDSKRIDNVTTAASIWYAAAIGMAIGFDYHWIALMATLYAVIITGIPNVTPLVKPHVKRAQGLRKPRQSAAKAAATPRDE
jgi:putative Mg2+ transporter-C (MgtC) family protein